MNVEEMMESAKKKIYSKKIEQWTEELENLLERKQKAQLVLDNIDREIEERKIALTDKIDSLMSCKLPGLSSKSSGSGT